jgi:hypothetical protein
LLTYSFISFIADSVVSKAIDNKRLVDINILKDSFSISNAVTLVPVDLELFLPHEAPTLVPIPGTTTVP